MNTTDEVYEKLEELRIKFQYEIEMADNLINDNIFSIGKKLDEIINQYYKIRTKLSVDRDL